jgi:hypothetical protein
MTWTDPRTGVTTADPRGPEWGYPHRSGGLPEMPAPPVPPDHTRRTIVIIALVLVGAIGGFAITSWLLHDDNAASTAPAPTPPTTPSGAAPGPTPAPRPRPTPTDPDANVLDGLVVRTSDVSPGAIVATIPGGQDVTGETTLDLCNGTFPSETKRTARRQVEVVDVTLAAPVSTEAVLYGHPADAGQALSELRRVASRCPASPVVSPVGEPTATTRFSAPPDRSWATTPSVQRQAYAFTITDELGETSPGVSVYLRRGRVLVAVYFSQPDAEQIAIDGYTSIPAIVGEFEHRIAALPASVVNGP